MSAAVNILEEEVRRLRNEIDNLKVMPWFVYICNYCRWTSSLVRSGAKLTHTCDVWAEAAAAQDVA